MKAFSTIFVMLGFFACGMYFSWSSKNFPNEMAYMEMPRSSRDPAAIKKVYDFSNLEGNALSFAAKQRLLDGVKVVRENQDIGLELGHFVIKGPGGEKTFACQKYSRVVLSFLGEGVAVAGEQPLMEVEGGCEISSDINSIAAIWIPVSKILGEPVGDGEFDFREDKVAKLKFAHVSDQWPKLWRLNGVRLLDPSGASEEVTIPSSELKQLLKKPFLLHF